MNYNMLLVSLGFSFLGHNSYADDPTTEQKKAQQFTPLVCEGSYASSTADIFSHNLFTAIKYARLMPDHIREGNRKFFY